MLDKAIFDEYFQKLNCKISFWGSADEGESIFFGLYGDGKLLYSSVTDSFRYDGKLALDDYLKREKIEKINHLFWTHPHDDHSDGVIELINDYKPEEVFLSPELAKIPESINSTLSRTVLETINGYKSYDKRYNYQPIIRSISAGLPLIDQTLKVNDFSIPFKAYVLAPSSAMVRKAAVNSYTSLNDYSIVVEYEIGDFCIVLTGDVQDKMIKPACQECSFSASTPNVLKLPHHGSNTSWKIMEFFNGGTHQDPINLCLTTNKKSSGLPKEESLKYYSNHCINLFRIDSKYSGLCEYSIDVDILSATITKKTATGFIPYKTTHNH